MNFWNIIEQVILFLTALLTVFQEYRHRKEKKEANGN